MVLAVCGLMGCGSGAEELLKRGDEAQARGDQLRAIMLWDPAHFASAGEAVQKEARARRKAAVLTFAREDGRTHPALAKQLLGSLTPAERSRPEVAEATLTVNLAQLEQECAPVVRSDSLAKLAAAHPKDARVSLALARSRADEGKWKEAQAVLKAHVKAHPDAEQAADVVALERAISQNVYKSVRGAEVDRLASALRAELAALDGCKAEKLGGLWKEIIRLAPTDPGYRTIYNLVSEANGCVTRSIERQITQTRDARIAARKKWFGDQHKNLFGGSCVDAQLVGEQLDLLALVCPKMDRNELKIFAKNYRLQGDMQADKVHPFAKLGVRGVVARQRLDGPDVKLVTFDPPDVEALVKKSYADAQIPLPLKLPSPG